MKFIRLNYNIVPCNIYLLLLILVFSFSGSDALAQKKSRKKIMQFEAELQFATIYDNNILKYSDKYLERFLNNEDQGRFHIDTYDDVILFQSVDLSSTFRIFKNLKSKINFDFNNNLYVVNGIKNWYYATLGFQQYLTKRASLKIFYSYMPDFYVRHFRDDDWVDIYGYTPETFVPFGYSKDNFGFWIQNTFFKNTRVKLSMDYSKYYYNKHYTEYDSKNFLYAVNLYQTVFKNLKLEIGYHFLTSNAKGYDERGETRENSNDSDASYEEDGYRFGITWQLPAIKKIDHDLDVELEFERRYFSSKHYLELDPEHAGRVDNNFQMAVTYNIKLNKSLKLSAFYNYFMRDTNTSAVENQVYLSAEKDYRQNQFGLKISYNLKF
ncbi:MAG: hypothetical protein M0Q51_05285 [Bacteroidales bacterium]|nr:hypothetical protein [Bacteroidales bacterium]